MLEKRRPTKKRNVSETTVSSSNGSGDFDYFSVSNRTEELAMDQSSAYSSSESDDEHSYEVANHRRNTKKPKCFTKNAILARKNRIKKKKYLEDLENEVKSLRSENSALRINVDGYRTDMDVVRKENRYLRNVLASRREISRLLGVIQDKTGLLTSSSLCKDKSNLLTSSALCREKTVVENISNEPNERLTSSISDPKQSKQLSLNVLHDVDSDIFPQDESLSPITLNDVPLSGPECDDDSPIPLNLFGSDDHDYLDFDADIPEDWLGGDEEMPNIGVCLHVAKKKVSLEFCQHCNENASRCWDGNLS